MKVKTDIFTSDDIKIYYTGKFQDFTARYIIKKGFLLDLCVCFSLRLFMFNFLVFKAGFDTRASTLSYLVMTQVALVDNVDQDQTAQNMQSDLWSTLSTELF